MILILFDAMTEEEIDFTNKIFSKTNVKMYNLSFNILKDKFDAEEAVTQTFLKVMDNIEKIFALSYSQIEPYCLIILKNEIIKIIKKRKKIANIDSIEYLNHGGKDYNIEEYLKTVNKEKLMSRFNNIVYEGLSTEQTNQLVRKICLLPLEYRNILFFGYCFNSTLYEMDKILGIENSISKLRCAQKMLCGFMGVGNSWIHYDAMKSACQIALVEEMKDYDNTEELHKPNYSKDLKHTQKAG